MIRHTISDRIWEQFKDHLARPRKKRYIGRPTANLRKMLNGVFWILNTGSPWRDLPKEFGPWETVYSYFNFWSKNGILEQIFEAISSEKDLETHSIDSTSIKVHKHGCGAVGGKKKARISMSCGGVTSKIHACVDGLGLPVKLLLTDGSTHDSVVALELLENCKAEAVLADKAYYSKQIKAKIEENNAQCVIPSKSDSKEKNEIDEHLYKERHLVECFFQKIKEHRRVATRYDKLVATYMGFVFLSAILLWLK